MPDTKIPQRTKLGLTAIGLLLVGTAAGAGAVQLTRPAIEMAPMTPVAIARVAQTSGPITLRGRVAEVYGDKFILADGSGKTLVDLGPRGDGGALVTTGKVETVQGRYDRGLVHASFLVDGSGNVTELAPLHGPHDRGPHAPPPPPGGPDRAPPPPPPGAADDATPPPPPPPAPGAAAPVSPRTQPANAPAPTAPASAAPAAR